MLISVSATASHDDLIILFVYLFIYWRLIALQPHRVTSGLFTGSNLTQVTYDKRNTHLRLTSLQMRVRNPSINNIHSSVYEHTLETHIIANELETHLIIIDMLCLWTHTWLTSLRMRVRNPSNNNTNITIHSLWINTHLRLTALQWESETYVNIRSSAPKHRL